jgi:NDP-sugar pyrophosphorylase family protein
MIILILAAGSDQSRTGNPYPMCLTEFDSVPLIERVTISCRSLKPEQLIVLFRNEDVRTYHLDNVVTLLFPGSQIREVHGETQGAACTALLAIGECDTEEELLILNGNEFLDADFSEIVRGFRSRGLDAGVVVFRSIHPRYSYVRLDDAGIVVEASEKNPISNHATAGFYWYKHGSEFVRAAKSLIRKDAQVNGLFYICPTFNELILRGQTIGVHPVNDRVYHPLKDERQVRQFETATEQGSET